MGLAEVRRGRKFGKPKVVLETIWGGVTMKELKEAA
jgi:hypothetical protein